MNTQVFVAPTDLRDYAKHRGWTLVPAPLGSRIYVMANPAFPRRQLVFPMDTTAPDYGEAVQIVVEKLAEMEGQDTVAVFRSLGELGDDTISLGVSTHRLEDQSLPLAFAGSIVAGAQQMLLAAASTVLRPQTHHPRLNRSEAQQLLEAARFRHTQPGSFTLNVSCPVRALDVPSVEGPADSLPFVRRATFTLRRAVEALVHAIETDSLDAFVEANKREVQPIVSSNLCEALTRFEDPDLKNSVELRFRWAATLPPPDLEGRESIVRLQYDYFPRIEEVRRELRPNEAHIDDRFPATVERLLGEMNADGKRSGEVGLSLLTQDGEQVRARVNLNAEQYELADKAHMTEGAYVWVQGKLHPGRQPRLLSHIQSFELYEPNR